MTPNPKTPWLRYAVALAALVLPAMIPGAPAAAATATISIQLAGDGGAASSSTRYYLAGDDSDDESGREAYHRATDYYHRERYQRAGEAYARAAELGYRRATSLYNAGCSYALAGMPDEAIKALRSAFDEGFEDPDMFAADEDLNSLREDARFEKLLDDAMNSDEAQQRRRAANRDFERLEKRKVVDDGDWNSIGIDLLRSGDYDRAAVAFQREFDVEESGTALYNQACARALGGKPDEALALLERAILLGPVDADHMEEDPDLMSLQKKDRFKKLHALAEDLDLDGGWSWHWGDWGRRSEAKRWRKALPKFEQVTKDHPDIGRAWSNLALAQLRANEPEKSTASFQKALDLKYRPGATMYNLACSTAQSGEIDAAFGWLERAEEAGFEVDSHAGWDDDLEPLHDDARFDKYEKHWKKEARAKISDFLDRDYD